MFAKECNCNLIRLWCAFPTGSCCLSVNTSRHRCSQCCQLLGTTVLFFFFYISIPIYRKQWKINIFKIRSIFLNEQQQIWIWLHLFGVNRGENVHIGSSFGKQKCEFSGSFNSQSFNAHSVKTNHDSTRTNNKGELCTMCSFKAEHSVRRLVQQIRDWTNGLENRIKGCRELFESSLDRYFIKKLVLSSNNVELWV